MPALRLMLVQAPVEQGVLNIQGQSDIRNQKEDLDDWQIRFSRPIHNLFQRVARTGNYKVQDEFFKN